MWTVAAVDVAVAADDFESYVLFLVQAYLIDRHSRLGRVRDRH